jgi:hypothetical protein
MVGALAYLKKDPNGKGRGEGYYYHRGKNYYAKYSRSLDKKRVAKMVNIRNKKARKWFTKHPHMADAGTRDNL